MNSHSTPAGLRVGRVLTRIVVGLYATILISAISGCGTFHLNEQEVSAERFRAEAVPWIAVNMILLLPVLIGLELRAPWVRVWMLGYWFATGVWALAISLGEGGPTFEPDIVAWMALPIAYWYLYRKASIRAYFQSLRPAA